MVSRTRKVRQTAFANARILLAGVIATAAMIAAFGASSGHAALIEADFATPGDALLTLDTDTGLEWLDLTETVGLSYDELIAGAGSVDYLNVHGFQYATTDQVGVLWTNAGIANMSGSSTSGNRAAAEFLIAAMGCTSSCDSIGKIQQGQAEFSPTRGMLNGPFIFLVSNDRAIADLDPGFSQARDFSSPSLGNYLVRSTSSPVPEPSTALLLGLGFAGLAARHRRSKFI
jgi:hypothetical protein